MNNSRIFKLWPIFAAISAVILISGLILGILLGYNYSAEKVESKTLEVTYDAVVLIGENTEEDLQKLCESQLDANSLKYTQKRTYEVTNGGMLEYTFEASVSTEKLQAVKSAVESAIYATDSAYADAEMYVNVHEYQAQAMYETVWRGAVAVGVGVIVALVYIGIRCGLGKALVGACLAVHDSAMVLAILAITRIPVYAYAPVLFGAIGALLSVLLWLMQSVKMRENFKDAEFRNLSATEAISASLKSSILAIVAILVALAVPVALFGGIAASGVRLFVLPLLLPIAVAAYSSLCVGPVLYAPIKSKFDSMALKRRRRYAGAQKQKEAEEV